MSDDYVVGAVVGEGLMGPRYAGRYRPSGHPVALEEVPRALFDRPDFVERLAVAGRQAAAVVDTHVVAVYDLVRIGPRLYVVTELVRGRSLAALLGIEPSPPLPSALLVVDSVLAGLEEIHRAGLAHGDVCPDVVIVTPAGAVRVAGLGMAAVLAADPASPAWPWVQPPEGGAPGVAADLYAAGALLRELVTGARPEEAAEWPSPAALGLLVSRSLAPAPAERFPSAPDFRQELERTASGLLGAGWRIQSDLAARATRPVGPQPPTRRRPDRTVTVRMPGDTPAPEPPPPPPAATAPPGGVAEAPSAVPAGRLGPDPFETATGTQGPHPAVDRHEVGRGGGRSPGPPRRRWRRRLAATLAAVIVVAAAAAALVLLAKPPPPPGPLRIGDDVRLAVHPGATGGCGTTFTFTATGSLSGTGTLTYRWVKSTEGGSPLENTYTVPISSSEGSFRFDTSLAVAGAAPLSATVTFQILSPQAGIRTQTVHYDCSR